jgi:hypothetical protein
MGNHLIKQCILAAAVVAGLAFATTARLDAVEVAGFERQPIWGALHMDGRLGDPFWRKVKPLARFHVFREADKTTDDTRVRITFDDKWLYFGLECDNPGVGYDRNTASEHDGGIANDESVESCSSPPTPPGKATAISC